MMTILLVFYYSSNQEFNNDMVKIGGFSSMSNPLRKLSLFKKKLFELKK